MQTQCYVMRLPQRQKSQSQPSMLEILFFFSPWQFNPVSAVVVGETGQLMQTRSQKLVMIVLVGAVVQRNNVNTPLLAFLNTEIMEIINKSAY